MSRHVEDFERALLDAPRVLSGWRELLAGYAARPVCGAAFASVEAARLLEQRALIPSVLSRKVMREVLLELHAEIFVQRKYDLALVRGVAVHGHLVNEPGLTQILWHTTDRQHIKLPTGFVEKQKGFILLGGEFVSPHKAGFVARFSMQASKQALGVPENEAFAPLSDSAFRQCLAGKGWQELQSKAMPLPLD